MSVEEELENSILESERLCEIIKDSINVQSVENSETNLSELSALEILYISNNIDDIELDPNIHPFFD